MIPKMRGKKVPVAQLQAIESEAGLTIPASYAEHVTTHGCGVPVPGLLRVSERYQTRLVPTGCLRVEKFVNPLKKYLVQTEASPLRTFLAFALRGDYYFLLELTSGSGHGVYFWARHPAETLDDAFARTDKSIGMVSYIVRIADDFDRLIQSFEDVPIEAVDDRE